MFGDYAPIYWFVFQNLFFDILVSHHVGLVLIEVDEPFRVVGVLACDHEEDQDAKGPAVILESVALIFENFWWFIFHITKLAMSMGIWVNNLSLIKSEYFRHCEV